MFQSTSADGGGAREEWKDGWALPPIAMLAVTGSAMFAYSSGVFMETMVKQLGWTRAQFSTAFAMQMLAGLIILPVTGWFIDRFGPRRVFLIGATLFAASFSLLGLVTPDIECWWMLTLFMALFQASIGQTVWVTAVIGRFRVSRGLALAVTLSGLGLGSLIWPVITALLIGRIGWRLTYGALASGWLIVVLPLAAVVLTRRQARVAVSTPGTLAGKVSGRAAALRSGTFIGLLVAGGLFSSSYYGLSVHLVPILKNSGLSLTAAAAIGGMAGLFSIIGRIGAGFLLDRFPVRLIGLLAFFLPVIVAGLLLSSANSLAMVVLSVAILGLASGAEMDIVTYIAARQFGQDVFASIYALFTAILALCASAGPILAGAIFDHFHSYTYFLAGIIPMALIATALMAIIPIASRSTGRA